MSREPGLPENSIEQRLLILAPTPRDGQLCRDILTGAGVTCVLCADLEELCAALQAGAGAALLSEEAFAREEAPSLQQWLKQQPTWSEFPILLLTHAGDNSPAALKALDLLGNVMLLERPLGKATLISAARSALRERKRQYQTRAHLEMLEQALAAAEEGTRAKSDFLANMSHEIRTPMTVFLVALARLQGMDQSPEHRQLLEMADRAGKRLRALIDDILDFSQIEARQVQLEPETFNLRACVNNAVELLRLSAQEKAIALTSDVAPEVPEKIIADHDRLTQVLVNLVANAVKFTEQGEVKISVRVRDDHLVFAVRDTGPGIAKEKQKLLFRSFSQVDATSTRRQQGSGLGLAISKALVELMGGEIQVESRPGEGSTFCFSIPVRKAEPSQDVSIETVEEASTEKEKKNLRILVAEDESTIRDLMGMILRQKGYLVEMATDGREAVDKRRNQNYDLVLMDMHMPELDGMEAAREIRNLEQKNNLTPVRIIALTADVRREVREQCRAAGMDSFISKPLKMEELFSEIEK